MGIGRSSIREVQISDINNIADYWLLSSPEHLQSMGVDLGKLPTRSDFTAMLTKQIDLPTEEKNSFCLIWEINSKAIGHCNTNPTKYGVEAYFHTHIWLADARKQGHGSDLLKKSIEIFFNKLKLKKLIGEPFAQNPAPNAMLKKLDFNLVKTYHTIPGSLSSKQLVNHWELDIETFRQWS